MVTAERQPSGRRPATMAAAFIGLAVLGIALAFLAGRQSETAIPTPSAWASGVAARATPASATAVPTEPASAAPSEASATPRSPEASREPGGTPVVQAPKDFLPPGAMVRVVVDALHMRNRPSVNATEVTTLGPAELLELGPSALIPAWGPVEADGVAWYPAQAQKTTELRTIPHPLLDPNADRGWVAAGDGPDVFLELVPPRCVEGEPTLEIVQNQTPWERLACYGDRSIVLEGVFGCGRCEASAAGTFEPEWLATPVALGFLSVEPRERFGPMTLHFSPDGARPPAAGSIIRVTGHFDDPAARGCTVEPAEHPGPVDPAVAELSCRERFVVEHFEVRGIDEDFPGG